jgi:carbohydrate-selective porin OprB
MDKLKLALTFAIMICAIGGFLYWISNQAEKDKLDRVSHVGKSYSYSKGIIVQKHSYKGHSIRIKYKIDNVDYEYTGGWDSNPRNIGVGDSISFKYSTDNPKLIITELEDGY